MFVAISNTTSKTIYIAAAPNALRNITLKKLHAMASADALVGETLLSLDIDRKELAQMREEGYLVVDSKGNIVE